MTQGVRLLLAGTAGPGFFLHLLQALREDLEPPEQSGINALQALPLAEALSPSQDSGAPYSIMCPFGGGFTPRGGFSDLRALLARIGADLQSGRGRLFLDYCNESAPLQTANTLSEVVRDAGVLRREAVTLICQNRLLDGDQLPLAHRSADAFVVWGWWACRQALRTENLDLDDATAFQPTPAHDLLCLNATPRGARLLALVKLAATGLIDLDAPDYAENCQIPYVSFPGLKVEKTSDLTEDTFRRRILEPLADPSLMASFERLLQRAPLRVDALEVTGNALAFEIDLRHYRDSRLSVVTETAMNRLHRRITEKTLKPLALGQPCITIGHTGSLSCARELGFETFDDCLDNAYDEISDWVPRMDAALAAAGRFLRDHRREPELRERVRQTGVRNMRWTRTGFARHYYARFAQPILTDLVGPRNHT